jgi:3-(3-hydroxy-phenyl)propionate hydroxylase
MCSGIRDANNLAWKFAAILRDGADEAILDSYQTEREPHTRAIIETAIAMGQTVCLLDQAAAAARDSAMLARKAAGEQDVSMAYPDLHGGLLTDTPFAGALFPQPVVDGLPLDKVLGKGAVLIARDLPGEVVAALRALALDDAALAPFVEPIAAWLERAGTSAVLIRPDRHVFGTGDAGWLLEQWRKMLRVKIAA